MVLAMLLHNEGYETNDLWKFPKSNIITRMPGIDPYD